MQTSRIALVALVVAAMPHVTRAAELPAPQQPPLPSWLLMDEDVEVPTRVPGWLETHPANAFEAALASESRDVLDERAWLAMPDGVIDDDILRDEREDASRRIFRKAAGRALHAAFHGEEQAAAPPPTGEWTALRFKPDLSPGLEARRGSRHSTTRLLLHLADGSLRLQRDRKLPTPMLGSDTVATALRFDPTDDSVRLTFTLRPDLVTPR